jgi:arylsulfatase A-like enzyme
MRPSEKPNVLCFVTDQLRADHLACYGNPDVRTPNIDRLAQEGVLFEESYVANPVCSPNRASMFTGRYPKAHRLRENGNGLPPEEVTLPQALGEAGYRTASFGKLHLAPFGLEMDIPAREFERVESTHYWAQGGELPMPYHGLEHVYYVGGHGHYTFGHYKRELEAQHPCAWDLMLQKNAAENPDAFACLKSAIPEELHYNTAIADKTIEYLHGLDGDAPFFIWCSFPDPHHPFSPPAPWSERYDPDEMTVRPARREGEFDDLPPYMGEHPFARKVPDDELRHIYALEYGMISMVDHNIGRVLNALEEAGLLENTAIAFFSDHGDMMGDHNLILKGPLFFRGLMRVPTILRLPDRMREPQRTDAFFSTVDLCPTLLDLAGVEIPAAVQGVSQYPVLTGEADAARDCVYAEYDTTGHGDRLRYLRTPDWSLTFYAEHDYGMFFDLNEDPDELHNLWDSPAHREVKRDLLLQLLLQTADADDWLPPKLCHA